MIKGRLNEITKNLKFQVQNYGVIKNKCEICLDFKERFVILFVCEN